MTFVVTEDCIRCKYTGGVNVCPVDAFRKALPDAEAWREVADKRAELER